MSLATLARKTKAKQRLRTRGKFILNMTGRGHVLGMNAKMSRGNCSGLTKCAGKRAACCVGVGGESNCCRFPHGGKPAPQMGYRVYLNRKSKGAYRPGGGPQCCTNPDATSGKIVWKQHSNLDASVVITRKKDGVLACNSDVYTAKRDTCTGCFCSCPAPNANNNFTVDQGPGGLSNFYGFHTQPAFGAFVPTTINGSTLNVMYWNDSLDRFQLTVAGAVAQTLFTSISFVNCDDKTVRTYNSNAATFVPSGVTTWRWDAAASGFTAVDELAYWSGVVGKTLQVYIDNPNPPSCSQCCCPVKKNICGCRATDLVRYTRINKSFGCQTTKAIRQSRTASEQIARNRAKVDCIKPMHRTIFINIDTHGNISFVGCCGDQWLIQGQQYTFHVTNGDLDGSIIIQWCIGVTDIFTIGIGVTIVSFTVPKFNTSSNCIAPTQVVIGVYGNPGATLHLDYCKQAFKKPQMRSC